MRRLQRGGGEKSKSGAFVDELEAVPECKQNGKRQFFSIPILTSSTRDLFPPLWQIFYKWWRISNWNETPLWEKRIKIPVQPQGYQLTSYPVRGCWCRVDKVTICKTTAKNLHRQTDRRSVQCRWGWRWWQGVQCTLDIHFTLQHSLGSALCCIALWCLMSLLFHTMGGHREWGAAKKWHRINGMIYNCR